MSDEFVMVPRKLTREMLDELTNGDSEKNNVMKLRWGQALKVAPAEQHQGEPVALPERQPEDDPNWWHGNCPNHDYDEVRGYAEGWNACLDEIAKLGPLYTPADPGEVEQLRQFNRDAVAELEGRKQEIYTLRGHVAELRGMLRMAWGSDDTSAEDCRRIDAALSASAEPSAPIIHPINMKVMMQAYEQVDRKALLHGTSNWCASMATALRGVLQGQPSAPIERDERADFDAWCVKYGRVVGYCGWREDFAIWQARAALERKP